MPSTNTTRPELLGWVDESPGRGTWSIITSCFFTIFICTWTVIHPRVHTVRGIARLHKPAQLVKTLLAPELVCLESLQEWIQARKLAAQIKSITGGGHMKLVQAFYISMMGLRYRTPQGHRVLWPRQYSWLLKNKLIKWEDRDDWGLSEKTILDKSKADDFKKIFALCQVTWFVCQSITRVAHGLDIAPLEAMTIAYIFIVLITYLFWWKKPKDIWTPTFVNLPSMRPDETEKFLSLTMENSYDDEGPHTEYPKSIAWYLVSRDCDDDLPGMKSTSLQDEEKSPSGESKKPRSSTDGPQDNDSPIEHQPEGETSPVKPQVEKSTTMLTTRVSVAEVEEDPMVITKWDRSLYHSKWWPLICLLGAAFGALHLMTWNSTFPTTVERWTWRSSALLSVVTSVLSMQFETMSLRWDGPLTVVRVASPALYVVSRLAMMAEVLAAMRGMSPGVSDTYVISNYWVHFM